MKSDHKAPDDGFNLHISTVCKYCRLNAEWPNDICAWCHENIAKGRIGESAAKRHKKFEQSKGYRETMKSLGDSVDYKISDKKT